MRTLTIGILLLFPVAAFPQDLRPIVLAAARAGRIEAFNPYGLQLEGTIAVNHGVESISISPDGRTLYIAQEGPHTYSECCGLYSLNLEKHEMCLFSDHALFVTPSPDGRFLFTQGQHGVDLFDATSLARDSYMTMQASGAYNLQPSPDGRWLLGVTNSPKPSLDVFNVEKRSFAHQLTVPAGPVTGAWAGEQFYLLTYTPPGRVKVWVVKPDDTDLPEPKQIQLPDLHAGCNEPILLTLAGAPDRLFLAEAFGFKQDRRQSCPGSIAGGIYSIDPSSDHVEFIARSVHVNRMIASPDGHDLYVLVSGDKRQPGSTRLLHLDARSGNTLSSATLVPGDWSLLYARIPSALAPAGYVRAGLGCAH